MFGRDEEDDEFLINPPILAPQSPMTPAAPDLLEQDNISSPDVMNPMVKDYIAKKFNLADYAPSARQALVDNSKPDMGDRALAALSAVGAGFQGQSSAVAGANTLNSIKQEKQQKVKDFDESRKSALEYESQDPNSDTSKRFRATLKANFPEIAAKYGEAFENLTAADQKSVFQVAETKAKIDGVAAQRAAVLESKKAFGEQRKEVADEKRRMALSAQDDKDAKSLDKHLSAGWTARSGQAGRVQGKINDAQAAEALLEQAKTQPGGLDSRQIEELSQSTARLLGGGATASGRVEALVPHTFWGNAQGMKEYLSNHPTGAGLEKFTERMADTIKREKELAVQQKRQFQTEGLSAHSRLKKSNPDLFNELLESHGLDSKSLGKSKDQQALEWAAAHPNDPRAKEIFQKNAKKVAGGG